MGDQFSLAWRVLDAQYWGVAQRRRRIFLVADFGGFTAPEILFKQDSLFGNPAEGGETGEGASTPTQGGTADPGGNSLTLWDVQSRRIFDETGTWPALYGGEGGGHGYVKTERKAKQDKNPLLCLNDQGGDRMDIAEEVTPTLHAGMGGHPPLIPQYLAAGVVSRGDGGCFLMPGMHTFLTNGGGQAGQGYPCVLTEGFCGNAGAEIGIGVCSAITGAAETSGNNQPVLFENHGIDARYTGSHPVAPTMSARYGTGGNNIPLVSQDTESFCIAGNIIDRQPENGGNGFGYQEDIFYTLTGLDRHAVFSRQRSDEFRKNVVTATQSARQHKDAMDLISQPCHEVVGVLCRDDGKDKDTVEKKNLIRRLTPLECERLQGFPDGWTDIPGASDSARYKALGNSVAIPCVDFVLRGIAYFLHRIREE